ncbi:MAG: hypothetical protein PUP90_13920 [Nostoc sp. S4]|nr:hypothetical protein [Nostoc sp. S4]
MYSEVALLQNIILASRCSRAIATLLSQRLQGRLSQLGYGRLIYSQGLSLTENAEYDDESNDSVLDDVAIARKKFDWILGRLAVS